MPRRLHLPALLLALVCTMALGACQTSKPAQPATAARPVIGVTDVVAKHLKFDPPSIQVPAGTTVTWHFADGNVPHNVKASGFSSPTRASGSFAHRFQTPGTYDYFCSLHGGMTGRVVVVAK